MTCYHANAFAYSSSSSLLSSYVELLSFSLNQVLAYFLSDFMANVICSRSFLLSKKTCPYFHYNQFQFNFNIIRSMRLSNLKFVPSFVIKSFPLKPSTSRVLTSKKISFTPQKSFSRTHIWYINWFIGLIHKICILVSTKIGWQVCGY